MSLAVINGGCTRSDCPLKDGMHDGDRQRYALMIQARKLSHDLMRYELRHREEKIARLILDASLGEGRRSVTIPRLDDIGTQLGITRGNVDVALEELHRMRIVRITNHGKQATYEFNVLVDEWRCRSLVTANEAERSKDVIRAFNSASDGGPSNFNEPHSITLLGSDVPAVPLPMQRSGATTRNSTKPCPFPPNLSW